MNDKKPDYTVNVVGETCPIPLIEMRKAVMKAKKGAVIEVIGTHGASKLEIPMAVDSLGLKLIDSFDQNGQWHILIER
ncbi:SirA family protein [bacterium I07]|nr:SirA family protein [bacterium I07]